MNSRYTAARKKGRPKSISSPNKTIEAQNGHQDTTGSPNTSASATLRAAEIAAAAARETSQLDRSTGWRTALITAFATIFLAAAGFSGSVYIATTNANNNSEQIRSLVDRESAQASADSQLSLDEYLRGNRIDYYIEYSVKWNSTAQALGKIERIFASGTRPSEAEYEARRSELVSAFTEFGRAETAALFLSSDPLREKIEVVQRLVNDRFTSMANAGPYVRGEQETLLAPGLGSGDLGDAAFEMLEQVRIELQGR